MRERRGGVDPRLSFIPRPRFFAECVDPVFLYYNMGIFTAGLVEGWWWRRGEKRKAKGDSFKK